MKLNALLIASLATADLVSAHATIFAAWINDVDQGLGNSASGYIRSPPNNSPVKDVTSSDMTCNINGKNAVAKTLSVKAGDKFTFEWHHNNRDPGDDIIADSHKGPVLVYIAPTAAGTSGNGWVKIYEDGYDPTTKLWAVDKLISNKGLHSVTIPNIAAGDYLLRAEIIALHEGFMIGGAQFYMECVQIKVTSNGVSLPQGVSIPGTYTANDPGIYFNLYSGNVQSYPIPGPAMWNGAASVSSTSTSTSTPTVSTTTSKAGTSSSSSLPVTSTTSTLSTTTKPSTTLSTSTFRISTTTTTTTTIPTTTTTPSPTPSLDTCQGGDVAQWQQCGGINYNGPTRCKNGLICKEWNPYYFQCIMP